MRQITLTIPEIALFAGTRVALGAGIGLLLARRFSRDERKGAGWALFGFGALTTIPLVIGLAGKQPAAREKVPLEARS
jgi:hypothetical protein